MARGELPERRADLPARQPAPARTARASTSSLGCSNTGARRRGTTPGLTFLQAHLNRAIRQRGQSTLFVAGPGVVASAYLDGAYTERYPEVEHSEEGIRRLFRQFAFPCGIPSHAAPETPGSIHEGGELGYSLAHAYGAAFDNPDLLVACVVGDGEAETGPLAPRPVARGARDAGARVARPHPLSRPDRPPAPPP